MKRIPLALLLLGILLAACAGGSPDLFLDQQMIDLGEVVNGEIRTIEVSLWNEGTSDLVIEAVTTSCGCTKAEVSPTTISPGESGELIIEFDSGAHGPEANGPIMRQVFVFSNDRDEPQTEFQFTAEVVAKDN
ncbi:MAG: DUF1573 domain-containing protein [Anaerolineales bacterium]|nr:DUF1573 domain-containing protein [Anaerolineales bacterium]